MSPMVVLQNGGMGGGRKRTETRTNSKNQQKHRSTPPTTTTHIPHCIKITKYQNNQNNQNNGEIATSPNCRRDLDVISRPSESTIEDLSVFIDFRS